MGLSLNETYNALMELERQAGVSNLDNAIKQRNKKRLSATIPTKRDRLKESDKIKLYGKQHGKCARCKEPMNYEDATDDHIIPVSQGGKNEIRNRRLIHSKCNSSKRDNDPIKESKLGHGTILQQLNTGHDED